MNPDLEEIKTILKCLVVSSPDNMTIEKLTRDFYNSEGYSIPFEKFGFRNVELFLKSQSLRKTLVISSSGSTAKVGFVSNEKLKHIDQMVKEQKNSKRVKKVKDSIHHPRKYYSCKASQSNQKKHAQNYSPKILKTIAKIGVKSLIPMMSSSKKPKSKVPSYLNNTSNNSSRDTNSQKNPPFKNNRNSQINKNNSSRNSGTPFWQPYSTDSTHFPVETSYNSFQNELSYSRDFSNCDLSYNINIPNQFSGNIENHFFDYSSQNGSSWNYFQYSQKQYTAGSNYSIFEDYMEDIAYQLSTDSESRKILVTDFNKIRNYILNLMNEDAVFNCIYDGPSFSESWIDSAEFMYTDEFDVHIKLKLPCMADIEIEQDPQRPGFVNLNLRRVLRKLYNGCHHDIVYNLFSTFVGDDCFLQGTYVNNWLGNLIESGFINYGNRCCGYDLKYVRRKTAHCIYAEHYLTGRKFRIDFVAAFVFQKEWWMSYQPFPFGVRTALWFAVPKYFNGPRNSRSYSFSICAPQIERDLILDNKNLKHAFRLIKALFVRRECMPQLKSFIIKTVFLWEVQDVDPSFWSKPIGEIFVHMLGRLVDYFQDEYLPFFWDTSKNLLDLLYRGEIDDCQDYLLEIYNKFESYDHQPHLSLGRVAEFFCLKLPDFKKLNIWSA